MQQIKLKPINNRFKRLIHDHGEIWLALCEPRSMSCFGGENGITARSLKDDWKVSNFKVDDIIYCNKA